MQTVWVIETHTGHGENAYVMGVYASQEAARTALEAQPNMRVHAVGDSTPECGYSHLAQAGTVVGEPVDENGCPHVWAVVTPMEVHG
jgi:hypothetical protein